jgi:hypothetical protein
MNALVLAEQLNRRCECAAVGADSHAAFYSDVPVFVDAGHVVTMRRIIASVHAVAALPAYQQAVLAGAPAIARVSPGTRGVFAGFDFHIGPDGPQLIEINTNAGGAMLNAAADWRHPACCSNTGSPVRAPSRAELERDFLAMFQQEWRAARGEMPLRTIAIVDDGPAQQFLYPEFVLFAEMFQAHGIDASIVDAAELEFTGGRLTHAGKAIDLVYNRLTDFYFEQEAHVALRSAYELGAAVVTPHPHAHALFADKRNLARLTDAGFLRSIGAGDEDVEILLAGIPRTRLVVGEENWWQERRQWFFKPASGFGSRGAYRGDKLTRRVFAEVIKGGYVAQQLAVPGERLRSMAAGADRFKLDLRCYVFDQSVQLLAARLYQGQTTNFRTAGGGFAPVLELRDDAAGRELWSPCLEVNPRSA